VLFADTQQAPAELVSVGAGSPSDEDADGLDSLHAVSAGKGEAIARPHEAAHRPMIHARGAIAQIAEAVRLPMDGSVEVRLSPEELGRVKLTMVPGEAGLVVQLVAERPETLELLRRHVDTLAADLRDLGYSGLEFSFTNEGDERRGDENARENSTGRLADPAALAETAVARRPRGLAPDGRLDIRL
jgi:flagellar hook-length control protein FliK